MESASKSFFETITDMQKQAVETFTEATEKFQKNLNQNQYMDSDFFKKWYDSQMSFFNQNGEKKTENNPMNFFNTWMEGQMNLAKNWFESTQKNMSQFTGAQQNPFAQGMDLYNSWLSTMNNTYGEMMKNFGNNTDAKQSFSGLFNNAQTYLKMYEMWMPMMKSLQDKTFTPDMFKNMFNPELFKNMLDSMFKMQPDYMKNMLSGMSDSMKENFEKMGEQGKAMYASMKDMMGNMNHSSYFDQMNEMYNSFYNNLDTAVAPWMKLMTPGTQKDQVEMMKEMNHQFNVYNMTNSKMQYMMYITGLKAAEEMATNVYSKMTKGEDMSSFLNIYQEWLNVNDAHFVKLFDSEEYSKMQADLNKFGMLLKRNIDLQMEKSMAHLPLINRTEMDDLYKTIHDLKKKISSLEKEVKASAAKAPVAEVAAEPKKAASKKA